MKGVVPRLTLVTDRRATAGRPLLDVVAEALRGIEGSGLPPAEVAVQLRDKDLSGRDLADLARALRRLTAAAGAALYVNDRVDVALASGADGVHLGGGSLPVGDVARIAPALAIGISTHGPAEAEAARAAEAGERLTFAFYGPVRDTPSKRAYGPPLGLASLEKATRTRLPLVAIGGLVPADVPALLAAGAHGLACIRSVLSATDPRGALQEFCQQLCNALSQRRHRPASDT